MTSSDNKAESKTSEIRPYSFMVGIFFTLCTVALVSFSELYVSRSGSIDAVLLGATHMPPGAITGLFVMLVAVTFVRKISPSLGLNPAEMMMIYFMMVPAALLCSFGLGATLLPNLVGVNYFATPENRWRQRFFEHIPRQLVPWDTHGSEKQQVSKGYFEGLRYGEPIPWDAWVGPLIAWTIFVLGLFFLMACVATLLRKHWTENERLSFPLVQLPVALVSEERSALLSNRLIWMGFMLPVLFHGINGLHNNFPQMPEIPAFTWLNQYFVSKPWKDIYYLPIVVAFSVVGFSFLLPQDVSFSFWFFLLFYRGQDLVASVLGFVPRNSMLYPARYHIAYQSAGAFFVVVLFMLYFARSHLKNVWRRVTKGDNSDYDKNEFMSYRTAFFGMILSLVYVIGWCVWAGMSPVFAAFVIVTFVFIIVLVLSRCAAEVGLLMLQPLFRPTEVWAIMQSPAALGPVNLSMLALLNGGLMRDPRTLMPVFFDSMKAADLTGAHKRKIAYATLIAILISIPAMYALELWITYRNGGLSLNSWFFWSNPGLYFTEADALLKSDASVDPYAGLWFGVGALACAFLYVMRAGFWWWPFHPLGYAMGAAWPGIVYWFAFFLGWMSKSLILRYGGARTYGKARPFFLGLIFGEFAAAIFWTLLKILFNLRPPAIPIT